MDCECQVLSKTCDCSLDPSKCICDRCTGACVADPICLTPLHTPPINQTCAPCPIDYGLACGSAGLCDCGTCRCSPALNLTGSACQISTLDYIDCFRCTVNGLTWCVVAGSELCVGSVAVCMQYGGVVRSSCAPTPTCETNCSCATGPQGSCTLANGVAQCECRSGFHGGDCCASGGRSAATPCGPPPFPNAVCVGQVWTLPPGCVVRRLASF